MIRRIALVAFLVGAGLAVAPSSASADMCETVDYQGISPATAGPNCVPYNGLQQCTSGTTYLGSFGTVTNDICVPKLN